MSTNTSSLNDTPTTEIHTRFLTFFFFFFNETATTEIYTLSLPDALPISRQHNSMNARPHGRIEVGVEKGRVHAHEHFRAALAGQGNGLLDHPARLRLAGWSRRPFPDRKSTRLNSSHLVISYAVFCLKKKK